MRQIHLKTIETQNQEFALLIEPGSEGMTCDDDLYREVDEHGKAVIKKFKGSSYELDDPEEVSPEEFKKTWMGD